MERNMEKRILILGAGGFIGSNLLEHFNKLEGFEIYPVYHKKNPYMWNETEVDLTDKQEVEYLFNRVKPDIIIHCSAVTTGAKDTLERPWIHITDNVRMNALITEACHTHEVEQLIWFSCGVMYEPKDIPQSETDWVDGKELHPTYFGVGNMKVYTEKLCQFYSRLGRCKFTVIRNSNIYGPGDKFDLDKCHVCAAMTKKVCDAVDEIEVWGSGTARRDLVYIDDLVSLVNLCLSQSTPYELINCGAGQAYSIQEIISTLEEITGKSLKIKYTNPSLDISTTVIFDCDKAKKLGWEPKVSLKDGLRKTVEYYKSIEN